MLRRLCSSAIPVNQIPLPLVGWQSKDSRCRSGRTVGNALFDGNYQTVWDHYDVSVRQAMVSSLAFLKGKVPETLVRPTTMNGDFLLHYIDEAFEIARDSKLRPRPFRPSESVFQRSFDAVCPLPSSRGPASPSNMAVAKMIAKKFGNIPVVPFIVRHTPMEVKSTNLDQEHRRQVDAPRLIHFDTMSVDEQYRDSIRNCSILLYDDVFFWGNISEAARNILMLLGSAEVDIVSCFATGHAFTSHLYKSVNSVDVAAVKNFSKNSFELADAVLVQKDILCWENQESHKDWHAKMKTYIAPRFPVFVPNDIPF